MLQCLANRISDDGVVDIILFTTLQQTTTTPACAWWNRPEEDNSSGKLESTHPSRTSVKSDQGFLVSSKSCVNADSLLIRAAATSTSGTLNDLTTDLIMANNNNNKHIYQTSPRYLPHFTTEHHGQLNTHYHQTTYPSSTYDMAIDCNKIDGHLLTTRKPIGHNSRKTQSPLSL